MTVIDEIKTTAVPADDIAEDMNPCHWAQGMVYGALYGRQQGWKADVKPLTKSTDDILHFAAFHLKSWKRFCRICSGSTAGRNPSWRGRSSGA